MNYLKSLFAKDRWVVTRFQWLGRRDREDETILYTDIYLKNRYSQKVRRVRWKGDWREEDFPGHIFRG